MNPIIPLNLPRTDLELFRQDGRIFVICLIRKKKILLTPEEWVRQHFIAYLHNHCGYSIEKIALEKSIQYGKIRKRWDVVVYDEHFMPYILIECKAPHIPISKETLYQALSYRKEMKTRYIGLTNGLNHVYYEINETEISFQEIENLPRH